MKEGGRKNIIEGRKEERTLRKERRKEVRKDVVE